MTDLRTEKNKVLIFYQRIQYFFHQVKACIQAAFETLPKRKLRHILIKTVHALNIFEK